MWKHIVLKLFVLLYAYDTIILVENERRDLQTALVSVHEYCTRYKLIVNINQIQLWFSFQEKLKIHHVQIRLLYNWDGQWQYLPGSKNKLICKNYEETIRSRARAQFSMLIKTINLTCQSIPKLNFWIYSLSSTIVLIRSLVISKDWDVENIW